MYIVLCVVLGIVLSLYALMPAPGIGGGRPPADRGYNLSRAALKGHSGHCPHDSVDDDPGYGYARQPLPDASVDYHDTSRYTHQLPARPLVHGIATIWMLNGHTDTDTETDTHTIYGCSIDISVISQMTASTAKAGRLMSVACYASQTTKERPVRCFSAGYYCYYCGALNIHV